jgi:hypothetical protein
MNEHTQLRRAVAIPTRAGVIQLLAMHANCQPLQVIHYDASIVVPVDRLTQWPRPGTETLWKPHSSRK